MARFPTENGIVIQHVPSGATLKANPGEPILSPEHGWILYAYKRAPGTPLAQLGAWWDEQSQRHATADARDIYGPAIVIVAGASGVYHVLSELGGLNPAAIPPTGAGWYTEDVVQPTAQRMSTPLAPAYRQQQPGGGHATLMATVRVAEGQVLGFARPQGALHWRVRRDVYSPQSQVDPLAWLAQLRSEQGQAPPPAGPRSPVTPASAPTDDDGALLAFLALLIFGL